VAVLEVGPSVYSSHRPSFVPLEVAVVAAFEAEAAEVSGVEVASEAETEGVALVEEEVVVEVVIMVPAAGTALAIEVAVAVALGVGIVVVVAACLMEVSAAVMAASEVVAEVVTGKQPSYPIFLI
jgi:hypothetical protein